MKKKKKVLDIAWHSANIDWDADWKKSNLFMICVDEKLMESMKVAIDKKMFLVSRKKEEVKYIVCGVDVIVLKDRVTLHNLIVELKMIEKKLEDAKASGPPLAKKKGEFVINKTITKKEDRLGKTRKEAENEDYMSAL